jgi:hypothetical protein
LIQSTLSFHSDARSASSKLHATVSRTAERMCARSLGQTIVDRPATRFISTSADGPLSNELLRVTRQSLLETRAPGQMPKSVSGLPDTWVRRAKPRRTHPGGLRETQTRGIGQVDPPATEITPSGSRIERLVVFVLIALTEFGSKIAVSLTAAKMPIRSTNTRHHVVGYP